MSFSNKSIVPARFGKPHIVFREGWWRVSPFEKDSYSKPSNYERWAKAHTFASRLNNERRRVEFNKQLSNEIEKELTNDLVEKIGQLRRVSP